MSSDWPDGQVPISQIKQCAACGTPPAASVQVGGGVTLFWFACKTCGRKTGVRESFDEARQDWNSLR
jgi:ribosomal protein S14